MTEVESPTILKAWTPHWLPSKVNLNYQCILCALIARHYGWHMGVYKYTRRGAGPLHGQRAVYYADDGNVYFHRLLSEEYGVEKNWVVLRKVPVVTPNV